MFGGQSMGFLVFTYVGVAAALIHLVVHRQRHLVASAFAVGVLGAWSGALGAGAAVQGGWASFGGLHLAGAIVGAVVSVEGLERLADAYLRRHPEELS
jgi:hypothetical protein